VVTLYKQERSYCPNFVDSLNPNAAGDTKSEHFELAGVGKLNEKLFRRLGNNYVTVLNGKLFVEFEY
jgi:hypothetical protein